jgi:hypothetical protein
MVWFPLPLIVIIHVIDPQSVADVRRNTNPIENQKSTILDPQFPSAPICDICGQPVFVIRISSFPLGALGAFMVPQTFHFPRSALRLGRLLSKAVESDAQPTEEKLPVPFGKSVSSSAQQSGVGGRSNLGYSTMHTFRQTIRQPE